MSIENARFAYHTVGILTLDDLLLLGEALPVQIGAELVRAEEEGELTVGMDLKRLGEESGFEFQCDFSPIGPDSRLGLCVRISPRDHKEMTTEQITRLEGRILDRRVLANRRLTVIPFCANPFIMKYMMNNLREGKNWSIGIK